MGHERWFRGQHDGQNRPFDWRTAARQHGIPENLARALYERAMQQAHGSTQSRAQEIYLALLADARRDASRPSPGQPIAPCKISLTSYIDPVHGSAQERRRESRVHEELTRVLPVVVEH
jgi:hypothetical protein